MKRLCLLLFTMFLLLGYATAADCGFPYADVPGCVGTIAPTWVITAHGDTTIAGVLYGFQANFYDYVRVIDETAGLTGDWIFQNQSTERNQIGIFLRDPKVQSGDLLAIEICVVPDYLDDKTCHADPLIHIFSSDPDRSDDGLNHAYLYKNTPNAWAYVGMEDIAEEWGTDWDYNDLEFLLINIDLAPGASKNAGNYTVTPEPASLLLLGSGLLVAVRNARKPKS